MPDNPETGPPTHCGGPIPSSVPPTAGSSRPALVALMGNPNTGKTTLFNELTGYRQRVGNYAGVTVEKVTGLMRGSGAAAEIVDLPGTYSLAARAADGMIAVDVLLGQADGIRQPDLIISIIDASNLHRNLYLTSQLLEVGIPVVVALNMVDLAERSGQHIDATALARQLGVPVVPIVASRRQGIPALRDQILASLHAGPPPEFPMMPAPIVKSLDALETTINGTNGQPVVPRLELLQILLDENGYAEQRLIDRRDRGVADVLRHHREKLAADDIPLADVEAKVRYGWIDTKLDGVIDAQAAGRDPWTDRLDAVLAHRVWGLIIFGVLMAVVFQAIYTWAAPLMDTIEVLFATLRSAVTSVLPAGALQSLIVDGIIAGVGGVMIFLPQILILFLFLSILEDCGYMARAAFLMDRLMSAVGLNGRSFIPLLSSFACAIPGIMATRSIEDRRDRFVTILIAPLMTCSARLPIYVLLIGAFVPGTRLFGFLGLQGVVLLSLYLLGIFVAIVMAWLLRSTLFRGGHDGFLMELPTYKWPSLRTVLYRMYDRGKAFLVRAGTVIFAVTIVVWGLAYYPHPASLAASYDAQRAAAGTDATALARIETDQAGAYLRQSILGRMGRTIEPVVRPLGWDWKIGMAAIASFPAREVIIGTLGTIYNLGQGVDEETPALRDALYAATWPDGTPVFNLAVALSLMVFFALCCQCGATLAVIKRETNSWRWPLFTFTYMTILAYLGAWATYQIASRVT